MSFDQTGPLENASRRQLARYTEAMLQGMISYIAVVWNLLQAVKSCTEGEQDTSKHLWGRGIAYFVGSIGSYGKSHEGVLIHSLAVQQCSYFDTCTESGEASSNNAVFSALREGQTLLQNQNCQALEALVNDRILPAMQVPLVQATISNSIFQTEINETELDQSWMDPVNAYVSARSILPIVNSVNSQSALAISVNLPSPLTLVESPQQTEVVIDAIKFAVSSMKIDCEMLGTHISLPTTALCLSYRLTNSPSNFGLDVAEMLFALRNSDFGSARDVYSGAESDGISLQELSTSATQDMLNEPVFNLFLYSANNKSNGPPSQTSLLYADTFIQGLLSDPTTGTLAAEAVVAIPLWMYMVHLTTEVVSTCETGSPNATLDSLHQVASTWIGDAQVDVDGQSGHLLFSLANEMGAHFSARENALSVNQYMLHLFAEAEHQIVVEETCVSGSAWELHRTMKEIVQHMTIPLVQGLIHSLQTEDRNRVKVYTFATAPLFNACQQRNFTSLIPSLLEASYEISDTASIIEALYEALPCLGLTCSQVGIHFEVLNTDLGSYRCMVSNTTTLSGFVPTLYDVIEDWVYVDLDLQEIEILTKMEAFEAASFVYQYGRHFETSTSILAQDPNLAILPDFEAYSTYYGSETYGHELVSDALSTNTELSAIERQVLTLRFSQMLILPQAILREMAQADSLYSVTSEGNLVEITAHWDRAVALFLGSVDRDKASGSSVVFTPYDLGQENCEEFGTCDAVGTANVNVLATELLYSAGEVISGGNCTDLLRASEEMRSLLLVPVIQSLLSAAFKLSLHTGRTEATIAQAVVASRTLLPLVQDVDPSAALSLEEILPPLPLQTKEFDEDTGTSVLFILAHVYDELGIDCNMIGLVGKFDPCSTVKYSTSHGNSGLSAGAIIGMLIVILVLLAIAIYLVLKAKRRQKGSKLRTTSDSDPSESSDTSLCKVSGEPSALFDVAAIDNSFRTDRSSIKLSQKAAKALSRISKFGDDDTTIVHGNAQSGDDDCGNGSNANGGDIDEKELTAHNADLV